MDDKLYEVIGDIGQGKCHLVSMSTEIEFQLIHISFITKYWLLVAAHTSKLSKVFSSFDGVTSLC